MALVQHKVGATAKAEVRRLNKRSKRSGWLQRSNAEDEAAGGEGEVGMGELESIMEKAEGGPKIPSWVPDNEYLKQALEFLGRDNVTISDKILVEKFGETLYKETGFTDVAETINGRSAMIGFVAYIGTITKGDFLMQLAKYPIAALGTIAVISAATLVPQVKSDGYFPQPVLDAIRNVREERLDEIFTERAERINGRAAMVGVGSLVLLSIVF